MRLFLKNIFWGFVKNDTKKFGATFFIRRKSESVADMAAKKKKDFSINDFFW